MFGSVLIGLLVLSSVCSAMYDPGNNITVETTSSFSFENVSDLGSYKVNLMFNWKVNEDADFDGFLYKLEDKDDELNGVHKKSSISSSRRPMFRPFPFKSRKKTSPCDKVKGRKVWINDNNTSFECEMPCDKYFISDDKSDTLCTLLGSGYNILPKNEQSLTLAGKFGRVNELKIKPYRRQVVGKEFLSKATEPVYCKDTLVKTSDVPHDVIDIFCDKNQTIADLSSASGPPSYFRQLLPGYNVVTNRGHIQFKWKSPLDVSKWVALDSFTVKENGGTVNQYKIKVEDHDSDGYYTATVTDVIFGQNNSISVRPVFKSDCLTKGMFSCTEYGHLIKHLYVIDDIDACSTNGPHKRYCDNDAQCTDQVASAVVSSLCSCPSGYEGNGVNETFNNGTGCLNTDSCAAGNRICDVNAICTDLPPPNDTATCLCPSGYLGDGYLHSSGCTSSLLVYGLGIGLPFLLLLTIVLLIAVWRSKVNKKRAIELTLSKFIVKKDTENGYNGSTMNGHANGYTNSTEGIFGTKWEIDRNDVELKEIIGRGDFGVVYRAELKTADDSKMVALKMTPEASKESENQGFLAEISLISTVGKHENVMGMIGCCTVGGSSIWLITEYMKYGDLLHFLWNAREASNRKKDRLYDLTELSIYNIGKQVANGLHYLSTLKMIHGDVAARNVLVGKPEEYEDYIDPFPYIAVDFITSSTKFHLERLLWNGEIDPSERKYANEELERCISLMENNPSALHVFMHWQNLGEFIEWQVTKAMVKYGKPIPAHRLIPLRFREFIHRFSTKSKDLMDDDTYISRQYAIFSIIEHVCGSSYENEFYEFYSKLDEIASSLTHHQIREFFEMMKIKSYASEIDAWMQSSEYKWQCYDADMVSGQERGVLMDIKAWAASAGLNECYQPIFLLQSAMVGAAPGSNIKNGGRAPDTTNKKKSRAPPGK